MTIKDEFNYEVCFQVGIPVAAYSVVDAREKLSTAIADIMDRISGSRYVADIDVDVDRCIRENGRFVHET